MTEKDVKIKLLNYLHRNVRPTIALPEISVGRNNNVRSDIFTVNGDIAIYEIKTENDSLARLANQLEYYCKYANRVYVVVAEKFLDKLDIREEVGIYAITKRKAITLVKEASSCDIPHENYKHYWWSIELKETLRGYPGWAKFPYYESEEILWNILGPEAFKNLTMFRLKERYKKESDTIKNAVLAKEFDALFPKRNITVEPPVTPLINIPYGTLFPFSEPY